MTSLLRTVIPTAARLQAYHATHVFDRESGEWRPALECRLHIETPVTRPAYRELRARSGRLVPVHDLIVSTNRR